MENGINKKGFFDLKVEPHLKPISDLGIGFYNLDENTATLRFQLSNSTGSLLISENNLSVYGYFESSNGSVSEVIELEIIDELNGIAEITLDQDFLHASTSTKVTGQLYIGVKNVDGRPDYNEVAVLGEFTFEVADALINKISSFTKIEYIRMFSQLKAQIQKEVADIQEAIKNGADYVAEMQTVKEQGIAQINQTVTEGKAYIDSVIAQAQTNINDTATSAISDVKTAKDNALSTMNNTMSEKVSEVENVSNDAVVHVDDKLNEFNQAILDNEFVQPETLQQTLDNLQWQKHKITENDGFMRMIDKPNLSRLDDYFTKTEIVYVTTPSNSPHGVGYSGFIKAYFRSGGYGVVEFQPYNAPNIYQNRREGNGWTGWKEITKTQSDTGWIPFNLINGAVGDFAYQDVGENGFSNAYRIIKIGNNTIKSFRVNVSNISQGAIFGTLPSNFTTNTQVANVKTPRNYHGATVTVKPNGELSFNYYYTANPTWGDADYIYGEYSWIE